MGTIKLFEHGSLILQKSGGFAIEITIDESCFLKLINPRTVTDYIYKYRDEIIDAAEENGGIVKQAIETLNNNIEVSNNSYNALKMLESFVDQFINLYLFLEEIIKVDELINSPE